MTEGAPGERVPAESQEEAGGWLRENAVTLLILAAILAAGAYLRLSHKNWDEGTHIHPDERFLTMVTSALQLPENPRQFFDSTTSPMNPYNKDFGFFVYGTLPIFIVRVGAHLANEYNLEAKRWTLPPGNPDNPINMVGYDGVHLVGRALSGAFDLGCVLLVFIIGARLYGKKVGLLAAALYAFAVLPLQQSHFYTVDTFGTFFALLTFYFAVRVAQGGEPGRRGGGWITYIPVPAARSSSVTYLGNLPDS